MKISTAKHEIMQINAAYNVAKFSRPPYLLHSCILTARDKLDQRVIDTAVRQWHTRLRACVTANGEHFGEKFNSVGLLHIPVVFRDI